MSPLAIIAASVALIIAGIGLLISVSLAQPRKEPAQRAASTIRRDGPPPFGQVPSDPVVNESLRSPGQPSVSSSVPPPVRARQASFAAEEVNAEPVATARVFEDMGTPALPSAPTAQNAAAPVADATSPFAAPTEERLQSEPPPDDPPATMTDLVDSGPSITVTPETRAPQATPATPWDFRALPIYVPATENNSLGTPGTSTVGSTGTSTLGTSGSTTLGTSGTSTLGTMGTGTVGSSATEELHR